MGKPVALFIKERKRIEPLRRLVIAVQLSDPFEDEDNALAFAKIWRSVECEAVVKPSGRAWVVEYDDSNLPEQSPSDELSTEEQEGIDSFYSGRSNPYEEGSVQHAKFASGLNEVNWYFGLTD